jgi:hypothetical protein
MTQNYSEPVAQLLKRGETNIHDFPNYLELGLSPEHIPELIRLVEDEELHDLPWGENDEVPPEVYAQVHAWRALAQLNAVEAIPALIGVLHFIDEGDDDFVGEEIPIMLGKLGAPAIEPCRAYLADQQNSEFTRIAAGYALSEIGTQHPESREACVQALMSTLENYQTDEESVNAFTLSYLADLKAVEAAPLAEEIFKADHADESVAGDFEDFQIKVGLLKKRLTPSRFATKQDIEKLLRSVKEEGTERKKQNEKAKKEKNKHKQEKKARKRHKKK